MADEPEKTEPNEIDAARPRTPGPRTATRRRARPTPLRATPKASVGLLLERAAPWKNLILLLGVGLPIAIASRISAARPVEAVILAFVLPVVVVALALNALRDSHSRSLIIAFAVVALAAVGMTEAEVSESFFPGAPFGAVDLSRGTNDREIRVPAEVEAFRVEVDGPHLRELRGDARGRFEVELRRGEHVQTVTGELSRETRSSRPMMRRGAPTGTLVLHDADIQEVELQGSGPVTAHLVAAEGAVEGGVRVALRKASGADHILVYALAGLAVIALGLELFAARLKNRTALAGAVAILGVFAYHVAHRFNPTDPLATVMGGAVFALFTGGLGGWLLGVIGTSMLKRSAAAPEKKV